MIQKAQEFRTMAQGVMRVEEYEEDDALRSRRHQHRPEEAVLVPMRPSPRPFDRD
jgi:hypothetical protein